MGKKGKKLKKYWIGIKCLRCGAVLKKGYQTKRCPICDYNYGTYFYADERGNEVKCSEDIEPETMTE